MLMLAAIGGLATNARACTPAYKPPPSEKEQRRISAEYARLAASPRLAALVAKATDISVAHVASRSRAPLTDIPKGYRDGVKWRGPALLPVRYVFAVDRVLKGRTGKTLAAKPPIELAEDFRVRSWMVKATGEAEDMSAPRSARDFWHDLSTPFAQNEGGPGDCSVQWSYGVRTSYLIVRDAQQRFLAAIPLKSKDILPALVARLVAAPGEPYPYRPDLKTYLRLDGSLLRVRLTDCSREPKARVLEVLSPSRAPARSPDKDEEIWLFSIIPAIDAAACRAGSEYILDGWPYSARLHRIDQQTVTFEDHWMQLRIAGDKRVSLDHLRALTAKP
ncbi:hypothetical protein [Caulobacter sp. FWC2]|uniref:hypothetical protein n=1 Tax=Caulobacter sp. FWC2 TaxID=69664 RepID=UPI000C159CC5|nr:hypothetical protein [Caulobacter sp. FWC2]PIB93747.1 hypothetical protein CSW62_20500 [Caulobacter sp. FWC2]